MEDKPSTDDIKQGNTNMDNPFHFSKSLEGIDEADLLKMKVGCGRRTSRVREASQSTTAALDGIMEALRSGHYNTIGVLGPESPENADLLEKVSRRAKRDKLFDVIVMAAVSRKPNYRRIQDEIAKALDLKFDVEIKGVAKRSSISMRIAEALCLKTDDGEKGLAERANKLRERMLMEHKILVILTDLCKGFDLDEVGIPCGEGHTGCKLLMTSASEGVLSKEMLAPKVFKL